MNKIVQSETILGLYKGFTASVVGVFIYRGLYFGFYDSGKTFLFGKKESTIYQRFIFA
jgi:solute carrier family 25 (adenine nucleotide translocator) protein 4/5/6/31